MLAHIVVDPGKLHASSRGKTEGMSHILLDLMVIMMALSMTIHVKLAQTIDYECYLNL